MMFSRLEPPARQMLQGNVCLVLCCVFYLIWWFLAFRPYGAIKGMRSGWLLIPAFVCGVAALVRVVQGLAKAPGKGALVSNRVLILAGVVVYVVLLAATYLILKRPVTTELFLIVGWALLMSLELNALLGAGQLSQGWTILLLVILLAVAAVSIVCYCLYYNLGTVAGYLDGFIPLVICALMTALITLMTVLSR